MQTTFIEIQVAKGARADLGRPKEPPQVNKALFMETLGIKGEVLTGTARVVTLPNVQTSMDVNILLHGVCRVNGELFVKPQAQEIVR